MYGKFVLKVMILLDYWMLLIGILVGSCWFVMKVVYRFLLFFLMKGLVVFEELRFVERDRVWLLGWMSVIGLLLIDSGGKIGRLMLLSGYGYELGIINSCRVD